MPRPWGLCEDARVDYDLTRLGDREFEHLSQALALQVLGPGVSVYGDGPDGGREATFKGRMRFPEPGEPWNGYGVVQAKFKRRRGSNREDTDAFLHAVAAELNRWADPKSNRVKRGRVPQYLLFITNVVLSAVPGSGGVDRVHALIQGYAGRVGLKEWQLWHHDTLCRLLDLHPEIRRTYAAFITPSDVLARLEGLLGEAPAAVGRRLAVHAAKELTAQQWVRLGQAGHPTNEKLLLSEVAVDLPAHLRFDRVDRPELAETINVGGLVEHLIGRGETVLRPSCKPMANPRVVIVGGPGQGKSTLGQLLCQIYRAALLADRPEESIGPDATHVLQSVRLHLSRLAIATPACRRWPLQVSLSAYGDALAEYPDMSLLRFLAQQVSRRTPDQVTASELHRWLGAWPWLLVLDGLDEVAAPIIRERMLQHVSDFLTDAADVDADLMVVGSTRPQGYATEFSFFEHFQLRPLDQREAVGYAGRLAAVRHANDPDLEAQVVARIGQAAKEPITARLLSSPLQVTIMSILLERHTRAPQDRHSLFDAYYQTIYDREAAKPGPVGLLLDQQRGNVNLLHERVGLLLQIRAERSGDAEALLPRQDLHHLAFQRLHDEGHAEADAKRLATQLVNAATNRLVLLVPLTNDAVGFEIRSLQELMAARALVAGDSAAVLERLKRLAPSAHWRNTWLLAAGRAFTHHEHLRDPIMTLLEHVDTDDMLAMLVMPGARLAIEILDDDVAAQAPRYRHLFAKRALELLALAPDVTTAQHLADALWDVCNAHPPTRLMVEESVKRALATGGPASVAAVMVLARWEQGIGGLAMSARQRLHLLVQSLDQHQRRTLAPLAFMYPDGPLQGLAGVDPLPVPKSGLLANRLRKYVRTDSLAEDSKQRAKLVLERLSRVRLVLQDQRSAVYDLVYKDGPPDDGGALADPNVQEVIVNAGVELAVRDWQTAGMLYGVLANWAARRPVGDQLAQLLESVK